MAPWCQAGCPYDDPDGNINKSSAAEMQITFLPGREAINFVISFSKRIKTKSILCNFWYIGEFK